MARKKRTWTTLFDEAGVDLVGFIYLFIWLQIRHLSSMATKSGPTSDCAVNSGKAVIQISSYVFLRTCQTIH